MRTFFYLLFISSFLTFYSSAQQDFAPMGAEWYHRFHDRNRGINTYWGYTKSEVVKDSIIEGKVCRVINSMIVKKSYSSPSIDTTYQDAAMIIHATPDTVYYLNKEIKRFIPLYIFNVNVGDTISYRTPFAIPNHPEFPPEDTIFRVLITGISNTDINGIPLKTISCTALDMWGFSWGGDRDGRYIEKIGSVITTLLSHEPIVTYTGAEVPPHLRCYADDEINYIRYPIGDRDCDYIEGYTSVPNLPADDLFQIYPNPAKDYVTILNTADKRVLTSVDIYDMAGKKMRTFHVDNRGGPIRISIADLIPGNYILRINNNDQFFYQKLSVQ